MSGSYLCMSAAISASLPVMPLTLRVKAVSVLGFSLCAGGGFFDWALVCCAGLFGVVGCVAGLGRLRSVVGQESQLVSVQSLFDSSLCCLSRRVG